MKLSDLKKQLEGKSKMEIFKVVDKLISDKNSELKISVLEKLGLDLEDILNCALKI